MANTIVVLVFLFLSLLVVWGTVRFFMPRQPRQGFDAFMYVAIDMVTDMIWVFSIAISMVIDE